MARRVESCGQSSFALGRRDQAVALHQHHWLAAIAVVDHLVPVDLFQVEIHAAVAHALGADDPSPHAILEARRRPEAPEQAGRGARHPKEAPRPYPVSRSMTKTRAEPSVSRRERR